MSVVPPLIQGGAFCLPHHREEAEHSLKKLGSSWYLGSLGRGTAFHEAAAYKKLQGNNCFKSSYFPRTSQGPRVKMRKLIIVVLEGVKKLCGFERIAGILKE